ncbi:hypothetical protein C5167_035631 [Papaver somniferum]|uniref:BHLH domain-containing protein n=1 Tax=Papaver somniferum TaxID=3469 RepID=A0A4Y7K9G4_PAPSO|nr:transcription factor bHLH91-like isoform X1 [Papaver somniferum]RZC69527.1 hypothetical protein C5167_035631 [Papaver somniferum]
MFDSETHYFDPHSLPAGGLLGSNNSSNQGGGGERVSSSVIIQDSNTILSNPYNNPNLNQSADESVVAAANTMDFELDQQEGLVHDPSSVQTGVFDHSNNNWQHHQEMQEMQDQLQAEQFYQQQLQNNLQCFNSNPFTQSSTPDLLNLLHLPRCGSAGASSSAASRLPNSSISFNNNPLNFHTSSLEIFGASNGNNNEGIHGGENGSGGSSSILYDHPSLHLNNLPPQPPIFRDLFQSFPQTYGLNGSGAGSSLFGGGIDEREGSIYHHHHDGDGSNNGMRQFENSVLDFRRSKNININGVGGSSSTGGFRRASSHGTKHFTTEKQRREQFNEKYKALSLLVPNPSKKQDRATVVQDAIEYIKELRRTVDELKILVDKKRCGSRNKKLKTEDEAAAAAAATGDMESSTMKPTSNGNADRDQNSFNGPVRSSWLQRKSKETEVDVRIIDDDVTIKLIQRSKMNNLLLVSRIIDELQLDLLHVSGGCIGDHYSFWFNTKINEGSSVYASAIAKKLIEGVDKNYAASKPENNY